MVPVIFLDSVVLKIGADSNLSIDFERGVIFHLSMAQPFNLSNFLNSARLSVDYQALEARKSLSKMPSWKSLHN